jgi:PleD family two-component response regulator
MSTSESAAQELSPAEGFKRAKIEHYLERAQEYFQMARLTAVRKILDQILALDAANSDAKALSSLVDDSFGQLLHRGNGASKQASDGDQSVRRPYRSELVLVVDQDERLLSSLVQSLRQYGFQAVGAGNYDEAVETLAVVRPDVVISEVNFENGPRGFDLYLWLKTNAGQYNIPFLFLAARIDKDMLIAGKRFGVDDLILKPVDNDVVTASIINCLARRRTLSQAV